MATSFFLVCYICKYKEELFMYYGAGTYEAFAHPKHPKVQIENQRILLEQA